MTWWRRKLMGWQMRLRPLLDRWLPAPPASGPEPPFGPEPVGPLAPLDSVTLTDGVARALFHQFLEHRATERGEEETGWVLMGLRRADDALVLATLPAGAGREAGVAHVRFHAEAQAVASRILRQADRRLTILGIVHTHPGSLRRPSQGDLAGDRRWVPLLRGQQGVFGIGTADAPDDDLSDWIATQPKHHVQCHRGLRFSWYALAAGDADYRPLPVTITLGPDLAAPLWPLWPILETHADRLERLAKQLARLRFDLPDDAEGVLQVTVPGRGQERWGARLADDGPHYGRLRGDAWESVPLTEPAVDRGLFLLLAEQAALE